jgi:hypothetical protein
MPHRAACLRPTDLPVLHVPLVQVGLAEAWARRALADAQEHRDSGVVGLGARLAGAARLTGGAHRAGVVERQQRRRRLADAQQTPLHCGGVALLEAKGRVSA